MFRTPRPHYKHVINGRDPVERPVTAYTVGRLVLAGFIFAPSDPDSPPGTVTLLTPRVNGNVHEFVPVAA